MDRPPLPPNSSPKFATQEEDGVSSPSNFADRMDDAPVAPLSSSVENNKNWHQRKISWGVDTLLGPTAIDSLGPLPADISPLPSLRARSSSLTSPLAAAEVPRPRSGSVNSTSIDDTNDRQAAYIHNLFAGAPPHRRQGLHHRSKISSLGGVDLNDIIKESPMEQEAETYILKAIEQRAAESVQEEAPAAFASVPDDAISAMSSTQEETTTPAAAAVEPLECSSAAPTTTSTRTPLPQHATTNATYHRRKQTMEQQLYGLAAAIDAIQTTEDSQEELPPYHPEDDLPVTSATTLEQNASLLYSPKSPNRRHLLTGFRGSSRRHLVVEKEPSTEPDAAEDNNKDSLSLSQSLNPETTGSADTTYSHTPLKDIEEGGEDSDYTNEPGMDATSHTQPTSNKSVSNKSKKKKKNLSNLRDIEDFFAPKKTTVALYLRVMFLYIATPLLGIAAILFYLADNPPTGRSSNTTTTDQASIAWWLIFAVRQIVTFSLAKLTEMLFIDYLTIRSRGTMKVLGPWATLFILQSKGWPSTISLWSIFNFCLLSGDYDFPRHWLYWQGIVKLFGPENPAGNIVSSSWNYRILGIALALGIVVSIKRVLLGLYLGKRTFEAYADQLAKIMKDILMISEVAALAKDFEREHRIKASRKNAGGSPVQRGDSLKAQRASLIDILNDDTDLDGASASGGPSLASMADKSSPTNVDYVIDPDDRNPWSGLLSFTQQQRIIQLLGAWEEPVIAEKPVDENISVSALLQFRRSMACLNTPTPFGGSFGLADKREHCIKSSQDVYRRLLLNNNEEETDLHFETLALLGLTRDGTLDQSKLKELIRLFRPDRDGTLSILHFVKSIDKVYKDIRLLRAAVTNTSKIDRSFETIVNWIFYIIAFTIILSILGYSPMAIFLSISGVILAFAFMIGSASSKYFEGLLFILIRRPYAIGDGIHVMGVESEGIFTGHPFWYVEDVSLFTTSVMYMYTGERATLSNGSLANSRIVNATRSPQAWMYTLLKFPVDVSLEKLQIFNTALEQFFRNRPREWRSYDSFRATRLDAQEGFIEYMVICTHRNSWHDWTTVHVSKADMIHFCLELSKQLGIFYRTPPMPIDLTVRNAQPMSFATNPGEFLGPPPVPATDPMTMSVPPQHPDLEDLQSRFPPRLR